MVKIKRKDKDVKVQEELQKIKEQQKLANDNKKKIFYEFENDMKQKAKQKIKNTIDSISHSQQIESNRKETV